MLENSSPDVADGLVVAQREGDWIKVQIGRARYVKRFNLNDAEARQLLQLLAQLVPD